MFEFLDTLTIGKTLQYKGEDYLQMKHLKDNYYLAVKADSVLPAVVYLIKDETEKKESESEDK